MKKTIHPEFIEVEVICSTCGSKFKTQSTAKEIKVDTCSQCHAFYTGTQQFVQAQGRVDKFNKRYNIEQKPGK